MFGLPTLWYFVILLWKFEMTTTIVENFKIINLKPENSKCLIMSLLSLLSVVGFQCLQYYFFFHFILFFFFFFLHPANNVSQACILNTKKNQYFHILFNNLANRERFTYTEPREWYCFWNWVLVLELNMLVVKLKMKIFIYHRICLIKGCISILLERNLTAPSRGMT